MVTAIRKANSTDSDKIAEGLGDLTISTPAGELTMAAKTRHAPMGLYFGQLTIKSGYPVPVVEAPKFFFP